MDCLSVARAFIRTPPNRVGAELAFHCPRHDDKHPSLMVNPRKDLFLCGPCNASGTAWQLAAFLLKRDPRDKKAITQELRSRGLLNGHRKLSREKQLPQKWQGHDVKRFYHYQDDDGQTLYSVARVEFTDETGKRNKAFPVWCQGGWGTKDKHIRLVVYRLKRVLEAKEVWLVEGEEDVETLETLGFVATTAPGFAHSESDWQKYAESFNSSQTIFALRDNDETGLKRRQEACAALHGKVAAIKLVDLPGLPPGGDVSDFVAQFDLDDVTEVKERLAILADGAPESRPPSDVPHQQTEPENKFNPPDHWKWLDVADLDSWQVEPLIIIVEGIIAQGNFVFVAAQSQTGKTLLFLYIARMMAHGGQLFGKLSVNPVAKALYMVLEDPSRRIKSRMQDIAAEFPPLQQGRLVIHIASGFALTDPRMFAYFETIIRDHGFKVAVLDTYQRATPGIASFKDEEQSLILHRLGNLTRATGVTLIVIDHVRKDDKARRRTGLTLDDIKGTGGKAQNADCVILMERTGNSRNQIRFQAFSKDFDKRVGLLLEVSPQGSKEAKFKLLAELSEVGGESKKSEATKAKILAALPEDSWIACREIAATVGVSEPTTRRYLKELIADGAANDNNHPNKFKKYIRITRTKK